MVDPNDFFKECTLRICGSIDIDVSLASTFACIRQHIPLDAAGIGYSDLEAQRIEVVAQTRELKTPDLWVDKDSGIDLNPAGLDYVQSPSAPSPLLANQPSDVPKELLSLFPGLKTCSAVFLRLALENQEVGALVVWAKGLDRFTQTHATLLASLEEPMSIALTNARRYRELQRLQDTLKEDNRALRDDLKKSIGATVVGSELGLREVMEQVRRIAPSSSPALILGETGTGKEVIANAIHAASPRRAGPMITMQCGAVPEALLDSELFGHERGAFTGAVERKRGRFERADKGTLFLDEIGELRLDAQVKLLRVLQEQRFERVGGTQTLKTDVRVIAATHRDLEQMVKEGSFREDLWYRLNVLPLRIPPLRLRRDDIPALLRFFIEKKSKEMHLRQVPRLRDQDLEPWINYDWPGNVRELQNLVERALILSSEDTLVFPAQSSLLSPTSDVLSKTQGLCSMDQVTAAHIRRVLEHTRWRISGERGAAKILQMNPSTLRFRMTKLGISRA